MPVRATAGIRSYCRMHGSAPPADQNAVTACSVSCAAFWTAGLQKKMNKQKKNRMNPPSHLHAICPNHRGAAAVLRVTSNAAQQSANPHAVTIKIESLSPQCTYALRPAAHPHLPRRPLTQPCQPQIYWPPAEHYLGPAEQAPQPTKTQLQSDDHH